MNQRLKKRYQLISSLNPRHYSALILWWMTMIVLSVIGWYEYRIANLRDEIAMTNTMNQRQSITQPDTPLDYYKKNNDRPTPWVDGQSNDFPAWFEEFFETDQLSFPLPPLPLLESSITGTTQTFHQTRITPDGTISSTIMVTPPTVQGTVSFPSKTEAQSIHKKLIELGLASDCDENHLSFSWTLDDIEKLRSVLWF